jgi:hypothetical protein
VRLGNLSGSFDDESLRRMKANKTGGASGFVGVVENIDQRARQIIARLVEVLGRLRRYRSTPSRRTSCVSEVRSRWNPSG